MTKEELNKTLNRLKSEFKLRWNKSYRKIDVFNQINKTWLDCSICFMKNSSRKGGRPERSFEESSERTKRMKTKDLRESTPVDVLSYATQMTLRESGKVKASKLLMKSLSQNYDSANMCSKTSSSHYESTCLSGEDALAVVVDAKLTRNQYNIIRLAARDKFPSYKVIQEEKKKCYPSKEHIKATNTLVCATLQSLLDHTICRLIIAQRTVIDSIPAKDLHKLRMYTKWGFDGSSGHSSYKQVFHGIEASDSAVFITSIVPIRIVLGEKVVWQNPTPSSTRYCRPLKIEFIKESSEVSIAEKNRVTEEIGNLKKSKTICDGKSIEVEHALLFTMVDGKVCNAITQTTSTQKCYICSATSKDFNNIDKMVKREIHTDNLSFGLSILHGWIRFFECLLHLSYKLPVEKWQVRNDLEKNIVAENKKRIQNEFKKRCGLIVDVPKPGFGNSNDGNTARRFFREAEVSAEITKLDLTLIKRLHNILITVASGHEINVEKFTKYCQDTARYFVDKYPWYRMPPTMHKFLIHGPEIISHALLPIGQLSEEAQEACNKDFKRYREHHSRKCGRVETNIDIFNSFMLRSDPVISSKRKFKRTNNQKLPTEVLELLICPLIPNNDEEYDDIYDDDGQQNENWSSDESSNSN